MRSLTYWPSRAVATALTITIVLAVVVLGFYISRSAEAHHKPGHEHGKGGTTPTACNKGEFLAEYRNELMTFNTQPVLTRCEITINNDWGSGSPGLGVNTDSFTARWVGTFDFEASDYEFTVTSDDGIRLWVDGQLLIDQWKDQSPTTYMATKTMTAGAHQVKVEYYENGITAVAKASWAKAAATPPPSGTDPVLVGAGDIATGGLGSDADRTAQLVEQVIQQRPDTVVFTAGDNAYPDGSVSDFQNNYHPTWGRFNSRTNPAPGNHEYHQVGAKPYFDYFGAAARPGASNGNYSYELGSWHIIALNSGNCSYVASDCAAGSTMINWLEADLAANNKPNVLAYMHHPLFSSDSEYGDSQTFMRAAWDRLYAEGADIVIAGHAHDYERFAPQTPSHTASPSGIREFVVGTGGTSLRGWGTISANSEVRDSAHYGVLKLTLRDNGYDWQFLAVGGSVPDSGSGPVN